MGLGNQTSAPGVSHLHSETAHCHPLEQTNDNEGSSISVESENANSRSDQTLPPYSDNVSHGQASRKASTCTRQTSQIPIQTSMGTFPARHLSKVDCKTLERAKLTPPVTADLLRELDLSRYRHNMKLRMDINFDPDLHFLPADGSKADDRRRENRDFWRATAIELKIRLGLYEPACSNQTTCSCPEIKLQPRLPLLFKELKRLLTHLMAPQEHEEIERYLDEKFLTQQLDHGVLNVTPLAFWMGDLIKRHCAPTRDSSADQATAKVVEGSSQQDLHELVHGIKDIFDVLELMKLDVANYQLSLYQELFVVETVPTMQKLFAASLCRQPGRVWRCRQWFDNIPRPSRPEMTIPAYEVLLCGVLRWFGGPIPSRLPPSFEYDMERLERVQRDFQDMICIDYYVQVCQNARRSRQPDTHFALPPAALQDLKGRFWTIIQDCRKSCDSWDEVTSTLAVFALQEAVGDDEEMKRSITANDIQRAQDEISFPDSIFDNPPISQELEKHFFQHARTFNGMHNLTISHEQVRWGKRHHLTDPLNAYPDIEQLARNLAHISILHWRIWADLVYLPTEGS